MAEFGQSSWEEAFLHARSVAAASDATVADFVERQNRIHDDGGVGGGDDDSKKHVDTGAFNQPRELAEFVSTYILGAGSATTASPLTDSKSKEEGKESASRKTDKADNIARQICRAWLKHTYLGLGKPCKSDASSVACMRRHQLPSNVNLLYKDYSFMGLSAPQRKAILAKAAKDGTIVEGESADAATENTESKSDRHQMMTASSSLFSSKESKSTSKKEKKEKKEKKKRKRERESDHEAPLKRQSI
jgi:hypothetical protein